MNSKIIQNLLLSTLGLMAMASCTNLDVEEQDSIIVESSGGFTAGDPTALLDAAYNDLGAYTDQANMYSLSTHTSDELIPPTRGVDWGDNGVWRTLHAHTWDATHSYVLGAWNQLNERIFKANQILASNPSPIEEAEAKFLRAFHMWHVMDLYGQVPFREVTEGVDVDPRVLSKTEAFAFIEQDLNDALASLATTGPSADNETATRAAANFLLARMYLNKAVYDATVDENGLPALNFNAADMTKVVEFVDAITADGYSLESEYFTNFQTDATSEVIFVSKGGTAQNRWFMTLHYSQNPSAWNGFTTLADFYNTFDATDSRIGNYPDPTGNDFDGIGRGFLIGQQFNDDGTQTIDSRTQLPLQFTLDVPLAGAATPKGVRVIKYHPATAGKYILMRYGDAVLMKAEAIMRGGTSGETALEVVNGLRAVRGADALGALSDADMLNERGFETYWEGYRRQDQIRFATFNNTWSEKSVTDPFRVLFPIPQQAIDSNPNLTQNPGY